MTAWENLVKSTKPSGPFAINPRDYLIQKNATLFKSKQKKKKNGNKRIKKQQSIKENIDYSKVFKQNQKYSIILVIFELYCFRFSFMRILIIVREIPMRMTIGKRWRNCWIPQRRIKSILNRKQGMMDFFVEGLVCSIFFFKKFKSPQKCPYIYFKYLSRWFELFILWNKLRYTYNFLNYVNIIINFSKPKNVFHCFHFCVWVS